MRSAVQGETVKKVTRDNIIFAFINNNLTCHLNPGGAGLPNANCFFFFFFIRKLFQSTRLYIEGILNGRPALCAW